MTLQDAIAEVRRHSNLSLPQATIQQILNAVASGQLIPKADAGAASTGPFSSQPGEVPASSAPALIPKADAEMAVALAYQRAGDAYADGTGTQWDYFGAAYDAILSLAPADALAEVARLREAPFPGETGFFGLIGDATREAEKAMRKFPQPNYVISKIAEEAGEVVKAAIHCAENRETAENLRSEMKQLIAMLYRLWVEGDGVHGLPSVRAALATPEKDTP